MPLIKSSSPRAFKANVGAEIRAGRPMKQALAIAYSTKRKKMSKGGISCATCGMSNCKSHNGMAEGGEVNAMKPLEQDPANDNLELDEQNSPGSEAHIDPGISSKENSNDEEDLPKVSEALSLAAEIMKDRKRLKMARGGSVPSMSNQTDGDEKSMKMGSLEDGIDAPSMSNLDNDSDELNAEAEDGRESRGMSISVPHVMSDPEHDETEASQVEDYKHNDDSLIGEILRDRKRRRRE